MKPSIVEGHTIPWDKESSDNMLSKRRKDLFRDCALIEIIHLHDCLRGALKALENDVTLLSQNFLKSDSPTRSNEVSDLERRVAGRFKVIWSVFRAHSSAEDEFIWPTLRSKTQGRIKGSPTYRPDQSSHHTEENTNFQEKAPSVVGSKSSTSQGVVGATDSSEVVEQEEYEEDHADEERMFSMMDDLLNKLREGLLDDQQKMVSAAVQLADGATRSGSLDDSVDDTMKAIQELTSTLSKHLMAHLKKEEEQCMPLVVKHLSKSEIHDLVGKIMGKRSSDMIAQIMTMAVQNLGEAEREEMVKYMKQAMAGTFFDRWLSMSGWMDDSKKGISKDDPARKRRAVPSNFNQSSPDEVQSSKRNRNEKESSTNNNFTSPTAAAVPPVTSSSAVAMLPSPGTNPAKGITSQAELEKLIRAIATNPNLTPQQKNTTIQGLRDSVWKSNQLLKTKSGAANGGSIATRVYGR